MPVLLTLMLLLSSGHTLAQSYTTSTMRYYVYDDACDSTIVRNWKDTAVFTCSHHPSNNLYSHIFHSGGQRRCLQNWWGCRQQRMYMDGLLTELTI
ncbi:MAG: hypothetical protein IKH97_00740 [Bacteroidales bacterium]|nr:hypothetical protein [Bacteroidales bacterium]